MAPACSRQMPGIWSGVAWALAPGAGSGIERLQLGARGIIADLPAEYLRAIRPYVHSGTSMSARVVQLIDHADWLETALKPAATGPNVGQNCHSPVPAGPDAGAPLT